MIDKLPVDTLSDCIHRSDKDHITCKIFIGSSCAMVQAWVWNAVPNHHVCLYYCKKELI